MLIASGIPFEELSQPHVGIVAMAWEGNPCNVHLGELSRYVKSGMAAQKLTGLQFSTIGISDAITMGGLGMRYSLVSREIIADSIEAVSVGQSHDATISIPGCDKNMAAVLIAAGRVK